MDVESVVVDLFATPCRGAEGGVAWAGVVALDCGCDCDSVGVGSSGTGVAGADDGRGRLLATGAFGLKAPVPFFNMELILGP